MTVYVVEYLHLGALDMFELYATAELAHDRASRLESEISPDDQETWYRVRPMSVTP
jgi:hypothetical protein